MQRHSVRISPADRVRSEEDYIKSIEQLFAARETLDEAMHISMKLENWLVKSGLSDLIDYHYEANITLLACLLFRDLYRTQRVQKIWSSTAGRMEWMWDELVLQDALHEIQKHQRPKYNSRIEVTSGWRHATDRRKRS